MGEYAKLRNGHGEIKIGTCESMYYLRHDQQSRVIYDFGKHVYYWRPIFKDELKSNPGNYEEYNRTIKMANISERFPDEIVSQMKPGTVQLNDGRGVYFNLPCFHGLKLPDLKRDDGVNVAFYNGKNEHFEIESIKGSSNGHLWIIVTCKVCRHSYQLDDEDLDGLIPYYESKDDFELTVNYVKEWNKKLDEANK